jgi:tellurite resistance protein TerC
VVNFFLWLVFWLAVTVGLATDMAWAKKHGAASGTKNSARIVGIWVAVAALFGVLICCVRGHGAASKFFAGYLLELSLSIDNLFIFMATFAHFKVTGAAQRKALTYGIVGAIAMRMLFVFAGIALLNRFEWLMYIFGVTLILSAFGILKTEKKSGDSRKFFRKIGLFLRVKFSKNKLEFFMKSKGKFYATPLLACVIAIEFVDIVFAIDSVTAVLAITREPILVFSSNVFAIIGMRALYIYLAYLATKLHLLKYGISTVLVLIGAKMILSGTYHIPTAVSIAAIVGILGTSVVASLATAKK